MSHELRTPLNAIIGYAEMLEEQAGERGLADAVPDLGKIRRAGRHLLALINDILDLSKIEAGKMDLVADRFEIAPLVGELVDTLVPLFERNGNSFVSDIVARDATMVADKTRVRQILVNLLSNATKFTERGTVRLEAGE